MKIWRSHWSAWAFVIVALLVIAYSISRSSAVKTCYANHHEYAAYQEQQDGAFPLKWVWRNAKVRVRCGTEFIHAYHEELVAGGTVALAIFTTTLWWVTRKLVIHAPKIERAYISGGGGYRINQSGVVPIVDTTQFILTVQNYGKTPGTVTAYAVFVIDRANLPQRPAYLNPGFVPTRFNAVYQLGGPTLPITQMPVPSGPNPIAYGRLWYRDIFEGKHYFSFALPIRTPQDHTSLVGINPAYTETT